MLIIYGRTSIKVGYKYQSTVGNNIESAYEPHFFETRARNIELLWEIT